MDETTARLRERTGLDITGCYAFDDGSGLTDGLLAFVARGTKRATVGAIAELAELDEPFPAAGQLWGLLDGAGEPRFVARTVDVARGRLGEVTPAFAWDEGEDDGTLESWWEGHRRWAEQLGAADPPQLEVVFERFEIVWPTPDETVWLADGVRLLRFDERSWLRDAHVDVHGSEEVVADTERWAITALPALVCERDGRRVGALAFRPRPGGSTMVFAVDAFGGDHTVRTELRRGLAELARRHGWEEPVGRAWTETAG